MNFPGDPLAFLFLGQNDFESDHLPVLGRFNNSRHMAKLAGQIFQDYTHLGTDRLRPLHRAFYAAYPLIQLISPVSQVEFPFSCDH
ncbi:hypothetical protein D3C72_1674950 [compost metagenome]